MCIPNLNLYLAACAIYPMCMCKGQNDRFCLSAVIYWHENYHIWRIRLVGKCYIKLSEMAKNCLLSASTLAMSATNHVFLSAVPIKYT